ncbi:MAG: hypothetical protein O2816_01340 [Planctomycetota bacterium]|nr:hypothetical protein [Planctomycetota bacterium]
MFAPTIALLATLAAPAQQDNENPIILDAYFAGFEVLLAHPKDRGLARLAQHLPGAMRASIDPQRDESRLGVSFLEQLLTLPVRLRMTVRVAQGIAILLPFDAQLELHGIEAADARELLAALDKAFETDSGAPEPTELEAGLFNRAADGISMTYGVKDGHGLLAVGPLLTPGSPSSGRASRSTSPPRARAQRLS